MSDGRPGLPGWPGLADAATLGGYRLAALAARAVPGFAAPGLTPALGLGANFASAERRATISRLRA